MNKNEFIKKYLPKIGRKVNDSIFNTRKLTKTALLTKFVDLFCVEPMQKAYGSNDVVLMLDVLDEIIYIGDEVLKIQKNKKVFYNPFVLPYSLGNSKIGKDTLCISINTALLCYMGIMGKCSNCGICYASNSNRMYINEFKKNCLAQRNFLLSNADELAVNTIEAIKNDKDITKKDMNNIKFVRFNINGDILNNEQLIKLNHIAKVFKRYFKLLDCYCYTHNDELDLTRFATDINFNTSDFEIEDPNIKMCKTIFEFDLMDYDEENTILCNGNCCNCPYCKSSYFNLTVLFMAHGGQFKGLTEINQYFLSYLDYQKQFDYLIYLRCKNAEVISA